MLEELRWKGPGGAVSDVGVVGKCVANRAWTSLFPNGSEASPLAVGMLAEVEGTPTPFSCGGALATDTAAGAVTGVKVALQPFSAPPLAVPEPKRELGGAAEDAGWKRALLAG